VLIYLLHDGQSPRDEDCISVASMCFLMALLHVQDKLEELRLLKVKVTLEQATKAQMGDRSLALLFNLDFYKINWYLKICLLKVKCRLQNSGFPSTWKAFTLHPVRHDCPMYWLKDIVVVL
jgi:hypothetical protein